MKKVLLATSALFLTAGVASAELTFSGTAGAGVIKADAATGSIADTNGDYQVYSGIDINVAASATTDSGMTLSASTDIGEGMLADIADKEVNAQDDSLDEVTFTMSMSGTTITLKDEGVSDYYDGDLENYDIGISGSFGELSYGLALDSNKNEADAVTGVASDYSATVGYSMGGVSLTVNTNQYDDSNKTTITAAYTMGDMTFSVKNDNKGSATDVNTIKVSYVAGPATITLSTADDKSSKANDKASWDASIAYKVGAYTINASTDEDSAWEADVQYDLGGATAFVAADHNKTTVAGVSFAF
jgi:outer membrane protein OmpU